VKPEVSFLASPLAFNPITWPNLSPGRQSDSSPFKTGKPFQVLGNGFDFDTSKTAATFFPAFNT